MSALSSKKACRCAQSNCLECLVRANEQIDNFDEDRDCPTFGGEHKCGQYKTIERTCGVDFATLADTINTPREHRVAVMVSAVVEPNSAIKWFDRERTIPACRQLFFFDSRHSVRTLKRLLADCVVINHSVTTPRTMRFQQSVSREHWRLCQCDRFGCPGTGHRFRQIQARLGSNFEAAADAVAHTECAAASVHYDRIGLQVTESERDNCDTVANALDHWRVFDSQTRMPLLPEPYDTEPLTRRGFESEAAYLEALIERYTQEAEDAAKHCAETIDPLRFDTPLSSQLPYAPLRVDPIDCEQVKKFRRDAHTHCTPLCASRLAKALDCTVKEHTMLDQLGECYEQLEEEKKAQGLVSDSESDEESDSSMPCLAGTCAHLEMERSIRPLLNEVLAAWGARRAHPVNCSCLAEHFIDQCGAQVSLDLVPLPTNPVFPNNGNTVLGVESPLMRELGAKQAVALLINNGVLESNPIVDDAERGTQHHFETAIARLPPIRKILASQFGNYSFTFDRERACFTFAPSGGERVEDIFTRYAAAPSPRIARPQQRRVLGRKYSAEHDSYDALLRDAQRLVGAELRERGKTDAAERAERARTLTEVALHRGMMGCTDSVNRRKAWLPPATRYCLETAMRAPQCVERHARTTLVHSGDAQIILGSVCERSIVDELHVSDNRRMLMARITTCLTAPEHSTRQFFELVLFTMAALVIIDLCECLPNLRAAERQRAADEARRALERKRLEERRVKQAERAEARKRRDQERRAREREEEERRVREEREAELRRAEEEKKAIAAKKREAARARRAKRKQARRAARERAEKIAHQLRAAQAALIEAEREKKRQSERQPSLADYLQLEAQIDFFSGGAFSMLSVQ